MNTEKLVINATSADGKPVEVILREGSAPKHFEAKTFKIDRAQIDAIVSYIETNEFPTIKENPAIIKYCRNPNSQPFIMFESNPTHELNNTIISPILVLGDLLKFGINEDQKFSQKELIKLIRKSAHLFQSISIAENLIKNLQSFEIKFESNLKVEDNRRGVTSQEANKALKFVKGELPESITLHCPIFEGDIPMDIELTIEVDAENGTPQYSFYSIDFQVKKIERLDTLIDTRIAMLEEKFTCIEVIN